MADKLKGSPGMKKILKAYLDKFAKDNPLFSEKYKDKTRGKTMALCVQYVLNTVMKAKTNGYEDEEIFKMARHYFDEDQIDVGKAINMRYIVNHHVDITPEERKELEAQARQKIIDDEVARISRANKAKLDKAKAAKKAAEQPRQASSSIPAEIRATVQAGYDKEFIDKKKADGKEVKPTDNQGSLF